MAGIATERKQAEKEIINSEQKFRVLTESVPIGIYYNDLNGTFLYGNKKTEEIVGYEPDELIGKNFLELKLLSPKDKIKAAKLLALNKLGKSTGPDCFTLNRKDGTQRQVEIWTEIIHLDEKRVVLGMVHDISERKRADEALQKSEEKYRKIFENVRDVFYQTSYDGTIAEISPSIEIHSGYAREALIGTQIADFYFYPNDYLELCKKLEEHGEANDFEVRLKDKDDRLVYASVNARIVFDIDGKPVATEGTLRDITERKEAEEELRKSEENNRLLVENSPYCIHQIDMQGRLISVNPAGVTMADVSDEQDIIGMRYLDTVADADRNRIERFLDAALNGEASEFEFRSSTDHVFASSFIPIFNDNAEVMRLMGISQDITERKQAEEALRNAEIRSRTLLEGSPVCNKIIDLDSRLLYMSAAGVKRLKIPDVKPFYGRAYPPDFFPESTRTSLIEHLERAKAGEICSVECLALDMEGCEVWYHTTFVPARSDEGRIEYIIASSVDITERKQAEDKQKQLEEQLHQAQKMETLGTLAGGIAHDFNNILQAIRGYADMSMDEVPRKSQAHADLQEVMKATNRGKKIVQKILAFSRREAHEPRPLRIHPIVREALNLLRATLPTTIDLRQELKRECGTVLGDSGQIHQVVTNLCTNSFQAMGKNGGVLMVSLKKLVSDDEFLQSHPKLNEQEYVQLTVSDTGEGMDQTTMARIFEPFFTTKNRGEGTGLGLSVVHGIVTSHKGDIIVESEPGQGTTFRVYFPVIESAAEKARKSDGKIAGGHERVLLVDDDRVVISVIKRLLDRSGYDVTTRSGGVESLETFRAHPDDFDLVITDQTMPKMTGMKLAGELLNIRPDLPIILISGFGDEVTEKSARARGIKEFILKPVSREDLSKAVRRVIDEKQER